MKAFSLIILMAAMCFSCHTSEKKQQSLKGKWVRVNQNASGELIGLFRNDGTFDGIFNGKVFTTGFYEMSGDTATFREPGCNIDYQGTYKLDFKNDKVTFTAISDTCTGRREGTNGLIFKRVSD